MALCTGNYVSLFAGVGSLDLGVRLACDHNTRCVLYVEREAFAVQALVSRMQEGSLDSAPVFSDCRTVDYGRWRGCVHGVIAGFPCQPASVAGRRQGTDDERWLWPEVRRAYRELQARWVFLENVPGLLSVSGGDAYRGILADLAEDGMSLSWLCLSASAVGASHKRLRWFGLAYAGNAERRTYGHAAGRRQGGIGEAPGASGGDVADARCERLPGRHGLHEGWAGRVIG